jgi:hypothetical protein
MKLKWWHIGLALALLPAILSPLASSAPDGLERVAQDQGFIEAAKGGPYNLIADYLFPGVHNEAAATILAGLVGTAIIFGMTYGVARLLRLRKREA